MRAAHEAARHSWQERVGDYVTLVDGLIALEFGNEQPKGQENR